MARFHIRPSKLHGSITIPASKSHTLRAILFASLANGDSILRRTLLSPDATMMIHAMRQLGAVIQVKNDTLFIRGTHGKIHSPDDVIQCGNSGQVLRFVGALCSLQDRYAILTGDDSIRHNRPVEPLLSALQQLGALALSSRNDGYAPMIVKGSLNGHVAELIGEDSQLVSGLLIASAFAKHPIRIKVHRPGEKPWIGLTLHWFDRLKISYQNHQFEEYSMRGNSSIDPFDFTIPSDFSSAAFPAAAALLTQSKITLCGLNRDDPQGDKLFFSTLEAMGARFVWENDRLHIHKTPRLKGMRIDINDFIDAVPILAIIGCFAEGVTEIVNASIARKKESDRLHSIARELTKMGAKIEEKPDGLIIHPTSLHGAHLETYHDHRIAMALSVAAMAATGESTIDGIECVEKSYPGFSDAFCALGANIDL